MFKQYAFKNSAFLSFIQPSGLVKSFIKQQKLAVSALTICIATIGISISDQKPVHASMQFCNKTASQLSLAYARQEVLYSKDGGETGSTTNGDDASVSISGWWNIDPGQCQTPNGSSAVAYCGQNNYCYSVSQYYYAFKSDGTQWTGSPQFCVTYSVFEFNQSLGFGTPQSCPPNYVVKGFHPVNATVPNYTINLIP